MKSRLACFCFSLGLVGCVNPGGVESVRYAGTVSESSGLSALIRLNGGLAASGFEPPQAKEALPKAQSHASVLRFHNVDQARFAQTFTRELVRLGLFASATIGVPPGNRSDVTIELLFSEARHGPASNQYLLHVILLIKGERNGLAATYKVVSKSAPAWWRTDYQDAMVGKRQASQQLLDLIMPDIQEFLRRAKAVKPRPVLLRSRSAFTVARVVSGER